MPYDSGAYFSEFPKSSSPATPKIVTVARGDTLSSIAKEAGTTVKEILAANPKFQNNPKYNNGNLIFAGTTVKIPTKAPTVPTGGIETIVKPKENDFSDQQENNGKQETEIDSTPLSPSSLPSATPISGPSFAPIFVAPPVPVKTAPIDTVLFDNDSVPIDTMFDLIFENIGGQELINISRNDTVNGQQVSYQPIKNLTLVQQLYNTNNILSLQQTSDKFFKGFPIKLNDKIPNEGNGPNNSNVYIDTATGNIVIETVNTNSDEQIEAQITISGTIYEIDFEETIS
jgi:LysM repeat protein